MSRPTTPPSFRLHRNSPLGHNADDLLSEEPLRFGAVSITEVDSTLRC